MASKAILGGEVVVQVSLAEAKKFFSSLVNRVVYGKERVIILSRGKPKAAIISIEDLKTLESLEPGGSRLRALEEAHRLRRELAALALKPATEELDAIRGERTGEFDCLR